MALGDLLSFLGGLGEFDGLIELCNSLAICRPKWLCFWILFITLRPGRDGGKWLFFEDLADDSLVTDLTVVKLLVLEDVGGGPVVVVVVPGPPPPSPSCCSPLELELAHEDPKNSLAVLFSHNFGTCGAFAGLLDGRKKNSSPQKLENCVKSE